MEPGPAAQSPRDPQGSRRRSCYHQSDHTVSATGCKPDTQQTSSHSLLRQGGYRERGKDGGDGEKGGKRESKRGKGGGQRVGGRGIVRQTEGGGADGARERRERERETERGSCNEEV